MLSEWAVYCGLISRSLLHIQQTTKKAGEGSLRRKSFPRCDNLIIPSDHRQERLSSSRDPGTPLSSTSWNDGVRDMKRVLAQPLQNPWCGRIRKSGSNHSPPDAILPYARLLCYRGATSGGEHVSDKETVDRPRRLTAASRLTGWCGLKRPEFFLAFELERAMTGTRCPRLHLCEAARRGFLTRGKPGAQLSAS